MSFGQMSEIVFMLLMPLFFARLGVKWMLLVGMGAWVARYGLFAAAAEDNVSGWSCSASCCTASATTSSSSPGMIYVDKKSTQDIRSQAQGLPGARDAGPRSGHRLKAVLRLGHDEYQGWHTRLVQHLALSRRCSRPA